MEFDKVIRERFSTRMFKTTQVEQEKIEKILEAGRLAPTAKNLQPQKIFVVKSEEGLEKIDRITPCRYQAPVCLVVCSDKEVAWSNNEDSSYEMDATIVATHMILEATNIGVNSVWVKMFDKQKLSNELNLKENMIPICIIDLGYKEDNCNPSPMHEQRKDLTEIVEYI